MGSRKKQKVVYKIRFIDEYKKLPLNERIAFKAWMMWYARWRISLWEQYKNNYYPISQLQWRNY